MAKERKLEKERKKQDAAFVKSLPRSERKEARKQLTLEARARIAVSYTHLDCLITGDNQAHRRGLYPADRQQRAV